MALKDMALNLLVTAKSTAGKALNSVREQVNQFKQTLAGLKDQKGVTAKLKTIRNSLASFGPSAKAAVGALKGVATGLAGFAAAATASLGAGIVFTKAQAENARRIDNLSEALGISRQRIQEFQVAGNKLGLDGDKITDTLKDVSERIGELAAYGSGEAVEIFDKLSLDIERFKNLSPDQQLTDLVDAISAVESKSEQIALLEQLASDATYLQPLLENNAEALNKIAEEGRKNGSIISDEDLDKLVEADKIYQQVDSRLKGIGNQIAVALAPAISQTTEKLLTLFDQAGGTEKLQRLFQGLADAFLNFSSYVLNNTGKISSNLNTVSQTFEFLFRTGQAAFFGIKTAATVLVTFLAATFANILGLVSSLVGGLNKVGLASDQAYNNIKAKAEAADATVRDLTKQVEENAKATVESGAKAAGAFSDVDQSVKDLSESQKEAAKTLEPLMTEAEAAAAVAEENMRKYSAQVKLARGELLKLGVDVQEVFTGVDEDGRKAIINVGKLGEAIQKAGLQGEDAAKAFKTGFTQAISDVDTSKGLEALRAKLEALGEAGTVSSDLIAQSLVEVNKKQREINQQKMNKALEEAGVSADKAKEKVKELKDETKGSGDDIEEAGDKGSASFDFFSGVISKAREGVSQLSKAARNAFETSIGGNAFVTESKSAEESLLDVEQQLSKVTTAIGRLGAHQGFAEWALETEQASLAVQKQFFNQTIQLDRLIDRVNNGSFSMQQLSGVARRAENDFDLLDEQQLSGLQNAIDSAKRKMESLNDSANSTLSSLRQRLADIRGDTEEAQRLQFEQERQRLQEQLDAAESAGADEAIDKYQQAIDTLEEINKVEQRNRKEEQNRKEQEAADRSREQQELADNRQRTDNTSQIREELARRPQQDTRPVTQRIVLEGPSGQEIEVESSDPDELIGLLEDAGLRSR